MNLVKGDDFEHERVTFYHLLHVIEGWIKPANRSILRLADGLFMQLKDKDVEIIRCYRPPIPERIDYVESIGALKTAFFEKSQRGVVGPKRFGLTPITGLGRKVPFHGHLEGTLSE
ncbi:MAG: hypothetical protein ACLFS6_06545 [Methanomassiliicoccales archaeon]